MQSLFAQSDRRNDDIALLAPKARTPHDIGETFDLSQHCMTITTVMMKGPNTHIAMCLTPQQYTPDKD